MQDDMHAMMQACKILRQAKTKGRVCRLPTESLTTILTGTCPRLDEDSSRLCMILFLIFRIE